MAVAIGSILMIKLSYPTLFFAFFPLIALMACFDNTQRPSYDISNTQWKTEGGDQEISLLLEFGPQNVKISYGEPVPYERNDGAFDYSSQNYQGSIFLKNFDFDTGNIFDVTWLFSVSNDTQNIELVLFKKSDETRFTVSLKRQ